MDFAKKTAVRRSANSKKYVLLILFFIIGASAMGGIGFYIYKSSWTPFNTGIFASTINHIKTWAAERKHNLQHGVVKVKQLTVKKTIEEPQIHFEFYTALPNMQMTAPENADQSVPKKESVQTNIAANGLITNPEELEQEFSARINQNKQTHSKEIIHDL